MVATEQVADAPGQDCRPEVSAKARLLVNSQRASGDCLSPPLAAHRARAAGTCDCRSPPSAAHRARAAGTSGNQATSRQAAAVATRLGPPALLDASPGHGPDPRLVRSASESAPPAKLYVKRAASPAGGGRVPEAAGQRSTSKPGAAASGARTKRHTHAKACKEGAGQPCSTGRPAGRYVPDSDSKGVPATHASPCEPASKRRCAIAVGDVEAAKQAGGPMDRPAGMVAASAVAKATGPATTREPAAVVGTLQGAPSSQPAASDAGKACPAKVPAAQTAPACADGASDAAAAGTGDVEPQVAASADASRACSSDALPSNAPQHEVVAGAPEQQTRLYSAFSLQDTDEVFLGAAVSSCKRKAPGTRRAAPGAASLLHSCLLTPQPAPALAFFPLALPASSPAPPTCSCCGGGGVRAC